MKGGTKALWKDENIADSITNKAVRFIESNSTKPFFLYFATNDIHVPRVPHPRFVGKSGMGPRGDALLQFDWSVGEIVKTLDHLGLMENTLIVLTSDNGPVVDDGYQDMAVEMLGSHRPWGDFRGGKYSNFEAGTRVPFLVHWTKKVKPAVSKALVSQVDMLASFAALLKVELPKDQAYDSQDQLSTLLGLKKTGRAYVIESAGALSVSDGEWKYISPSKGPAYSKLTNTELGNNTNDQLYYLKEDVSEQKNVAKLYPKEVDRLKSILEFEMKK